ncbi:MAG: hypothetical protein ACXAC2_00705 [Candidatus Kariarchaeaceae archaeon]
MVPKEIWTLPRPRKPYDFKGGFPLHFEKKLIRLLDNPEKILHPFGGRAEYGTRIDLKLDRNVDALGDAHDLPFKSDHFDLVICDPPYNDELSKEMYDTPPVKFGKYSKEAVRVCKPGGFVAMYHWLWIPRLKGTDYYKIVVVLPGQWHRARICVIYRKKEV